MCYSICRVKHAVVLSQSLRSISFHKKNPAVTARISVLVPKPGVVALNATKARRGGVQTGWEGTALCTLCWPAGRYRGGGGGGGNSVLQNGGLREKYFLPPSWSSGDFLWFECFLHLRPCHYSTPNLRCPVASPAQILIPLGLLFLPVQPSDSPCCLHFFLLRCYSNPPLDQANLSHCVLPHISDLLPEHPSHPVTTPTGLCRSAHSHPSQTRCPLMQLGFGHSLVDSHLSFSSNPVSLHFIHLAQF